MDLESLAHDTAVRGRVEQHLGLTWHSIRGEGVTRWWQKGHTERGSGQVADTAQGNRTRLIHVQNVASGGQERLKTEQDSYERGALPLRTSVRF